MHVYVYSQTASTMQFSKALNTRVFMQHCVEYIVTCIEHVIDIISC